MSAPLSYISPIDFRLPNNPPNYGKDPILQEILNQNWQTLQAIIQSLGLNCGIAQRVPSQWSLLAGTSDTILSQNMGRYYDIALEPIAAGAAINIAAGGIQNANATNGTKPADGFAPAAIATGSTGEVILARGIVTGLAGLVKGHRYWLDTAAGGYSAVPKVAAGNIEQYLGFAITANTLFFTSHYWIQH